MREAASRGGGVYIWHSANNAFPQWAAYNDMIGIGWRKKDYGTAIAVDETSSAWLALEKDGSDSIATMPMP